MKPLCPDCGSDKGFNICSYVDAPFIECKVMSCHFTQTPDEDLLIEACLKTCERNNKPKDAA